MKLFSLFKFSATVAALVSFSACTASYRQCVAWRAEGQMFSDLDSCQQCVEQVGDSDINVVRGCLLGVGVADLVNQMQPDDVRRNPPVQP